ncbi:peptide/nickel transport system substrate-binding protein [Frankia sp. AiPs1]|uniref:ABC transporter substrate-binding protein n=1 Tax=Frankia sp. AiPa1 TaxID=573492 RepID=UPI00202B2510|nr:ABC transporter substrate-binding protein [Frankia sp. AiPa1]MCL9760306.1 ABC transporter substrate-binding protein [Frankia sp. AiPa1]
MKRSIRRRVLRLFMLPISMVLAGALVAACSGSGGVTTASSSGDSGVIKWAYISDFPSWDPVVVGATGATQVLSTIYEPLFTLDAQGKVQPALATGWEYNGTGTQITVTLRSGLTFQDGSPLNAESVAYNVQRLKTQKNSALKALWQDVVSATVIDDTHVRLNLKQADYQLPFILANRSSLLASERAAKADVSALNTNSPVGAGPFKVVKLVPGSSVTLEKWDGYWAAKDIHVKRITISLNVNPATVLSGLQTGVYNFSTNFSAQNVALAKKSGLNVVADVSRGWGAYFLSLNVNKAPFNNPKVVAAVQSAINRRQLVSQLGFGLAKPTVQPFSSTSPAYNSALDSEYTFNPTKAKQLLAEAGYQPGSLTIELDIITNQLNAASELLQQQLQDVGINIKINAQTVSQFYTGYYGKTDVFTLYGWVGRDSKLGALDDQFGPGGILNLSAPTSSPQYAAARQKVLSTPLDAPNYQQVLQAATKAGVEGGSNIALYSTPNIYVTGKSFSAFPVVDGSFRWIGLTV